MVVDVDSQVHFKVVDSSGTPHYVECMMCALKLLTKYDSLNITTYCDYNGPSTPIFVNAGQNGTNVNVNPPTALVIAGGGCTKNRVVISQATASALLANNGTSNYLAAIQKYVNGVDGTLVTVAANSTVTTVTQAALQFGGGTSPSPSPTPTPTTQQCEQCGMDVPADAQTHFKIVDGTGRTRYACCIKCSIKQLTKTDQLNITTNCDWYGPNFPITVTVKDNLNSITVTPSTAMIIDGSCTKNRVVYDQQAANSMLAYNGSSRYLIASQNTTIPSNATVMSLAQAVKTYGASPSPSPSITPSPTPSPSESATSTPYPTSSPEPTETPTQTPKPSATPQITTQPTATQVATPSPTSTPASSPLETSTPSPTLIPSATVNSATKQCEACTMDVTPDSQARYGVTDGNGNVHYVECFMCALSLIKNYETLHIVTYCDWYGPTYPITVDSSNYGQTVTANPSTAIFLRGGNCVTARAAYNQTAADSLLLNGFSQYTSPEQLYSLPSNTEAKPVTEAINTWYVQQNATNTTSSLMLILVAVIGGTVLGVSIFGYTRLKRSARN